MRILGIDSQLYSCSQAHFQDKKAFNNGRKENTVDILDNNFCIETSTTTSSIDEFYYPNENQQKNYQKPVSIPELTETVDLSLNNNLQEQDFCEAFDNKCKISSDTQAITNYKQGYEAYKINTVLNPEKQTIINQPNHISFFSEINKPKRQLFLIQTMGSTTVDQVKGDGAYAQWMNDYFQQNNKLTGINHQWIQIPGKGNYENSELPEILCNGYREFLYKNNAKEGDLVILNWHMRCTGRTNAWTGRGLSNKLINELNAINKVIDLKVVLTIHESEKIDNSLQKILPHIDSIITLNPDVKKEIDNFFLNNTKPFIKKPTIYLSSVPNLMNSTATKVTDKILEYIGDEPLLNLNLAGACVISKLKEGNRTYASKNIEDITKSNTTSKNKGINLEQLKTLKRGIVMFGSVVIRHGTTKENVENLCDHLREKENLKDFPVVISGSQPDQELIKDIASINLSKDSIIITGTIDNFDVLANCKYAISFDNLGFRDNASAMVNVIRSGHLLFCRKQNENDAQLIERATHEISLCERNNSHYIRLLEEQQSDFRRLNTKLVGDELCNIFNNIAFTQVFDEQEIPIELQLSKLAIRGKL